MTEAPRCRSVDYSYIKRCTNTCPQNTIIIWGCGLGYIKLSSSTAFQKWELVSKSQVTIYAYYVFFIFQAGGRFPQTFTLLFQAFLSLLWISFNFHVTPNWVKVSNIVNLSRAYWQSCDLFWLECRCIPLSYDAVFMPLYLVGSSGFPHLLTTA